MSEPIPLINIPLQVAGEYLLFQAGLIGRPLILPQYAPGGHIAPGTVQYRANDTEIKPNCLGVVVAIACSADDAQTLVDLISRWECDRQYRRSRPPGGE